MLVDPLQQSEPFGWTQRSPAFTAGTAAGAVHFARDIVSVLNYGANEEIITHGLAGKKETAKLIKENQASVGVAVQGIVNTVNSPRETFSRIGRLMSRASKGDLRARAQLGAMVGHTGTSLAAGAAIGQLGAAADIGDALNAGRSLEGVPEDLVPVDDTLSGAKSLSGGQSGAGGVPNSGPQISNLRTIGSAEANAPFISDAAAVQGWHPPYAEGPGVRTFTTAQDLPFVRVHTAEGNAPGAFLVRQDEIAHLGNDPQAIQNYLGLKDTPAYISDVNVPAGTRMQAGIIGPQPNFGLNANSGMQYQLLEQIPRSSFYNTRPLQ